MSSSSYFPAVGHSNEMGFALLKKWNDEKVESKKLTKNEIQINEIKNRIWEYYKKYYNTHLGKAEKEESIKHYRKFVK